MWKNVTASCARFKLMQLSRAGSFRVMTKTPSPACSKGSFALRLRPSKLRNSCQAALWYTSRFILYGLPTNEGRAPCLLRGVRNMPASCTEHVPPPLLRLLLCTHVLFCMHGLAVSTQLYIYIYIYIHTCMHVKGKRLCTMCLGKLGHDGTWRGKGLPKNSSSHVSMVPSLKQNGGFTKIGDPENKTPK